MANTPELPPSIGHKADKQAVLDYLQETGRATKNEMARAFGLKGDERAAFKRLLRELEAEGSLIKDAKYLMTNYHLPPVMVLKAAHLDDDGDLYARPGEDRPSGLPWPANLSIRVKPSRDKRKSPGLQDRFLARLVPLEHPDYEASVIKILPRFETRPIVGVFHRGLVQPTDRRDRNAAYRLELDDPLSEGLQEDELLVIEPLPVPTRYGAPLARIKQRLGLQGSIAAISTVSIVERQIPTVFSDEALSEAEAATAPTPKGREDLRSLPLVTIDGADARDFDDAVYAEPLPNGGHRLLIAIADVSAYVPANSALDRAARERGNSCYFPDQVVPMLPEALSNGWCSLVPNQERGCMAVEVLIDAEGRKLSHRFLRGLMRSHARLTYHQVEEAIEDAALAQRPDEPEAALIANLLAAHDALDLARKRRQTLDLEVAERQVLLSDDRQAILDIGIRERLQAHKIIEEFMILANVCAAESLEEKGYACAYRIHDAPDPARLDSLREMLKGLDVALAKGVALSPSDFNRVLEQIKDSPYQETVNEAVLRSQSQARYSPHNIGHFGLNLERYAHFTSPIRRYADLTVHRALIHALGLGKDGDNPSLASLERICETVSNTERRAIEAERASMDRYLASYHSGQEGQFFDVQLRSVTKHGLFVRIKSSGAEGLLPFSQLPDDRYEVDPVSQVAIGRDTGLTLGVGDLLRAELIEAKPLQGGLLFAYHDHLETGVSAAQLRHGYRKLRERSRSIEKQRKRTGRSVSGRRRQRRR